MIGYYLTHPQVAIDPNIPVPDWPLSERGRARIVSALDRPWLQTIGRIVSSAERKAMDGAGIIAKSLGIPFEIAAETGENDRSATGFLERSAFEHAADQFFAFPEESGNGWERAMDAQNRIVSAVERILAGHEPRTPMLLVGHGGVGTLLKCHLAQVAISRSGDQPGGGGNVYAFRLADRKLLCDWTPLDSFDGVSLED
ncbi:MAG TPA: histidine phosphatase family protein [Mesorhizobium sp.]